MTDIQTLRTLARKLGMPGITNFVHAMRDEAARAPDKLTEDEAATVARFVDELDITPLPADL